MNHRASVTSLCFALLAAGLGVGSVCAQSGDRPLDLTLAPSKGFPVVSAASNTAAGTMPLAVAAAAATSNPVPATSAGTAPGRSRNDIRAANVAALVANPPDPATASCDDAADNKAQVHGSVDVGVVAGDHVSGNYQSATVNITKPLGDCNDPGKTLSITVHASQSRTRFSRGSH